MSKARKWYSRMAPRELDAIVAKFDREIDASELKPLTPTMRRQEARAKRRKAGRPKVGNGAARILVSMERGLLANLNTHVRKQKTTRAAFIAQAVREHLARAS